MMKRPLKDKRPVGPFVSASRSHGNTVLLTSDWLMSESMLKRFEKVDKNLNRVGLVRRTEGIGEEYFDGEVADVRIEDNIVKDRDGNVRRGIRVVYDTQANAIDHEDVEDFKHDLKFELGAKGQFKHLTIVGADG